MDLALYQPDIPQNTGAMLRLCACLGVGAHIIEPAGFVLDDKRLRRGAMDYLDHVTLHRHSSWAAFKTARAGNPDAGRPDAGRLVLLTTKGAVAYTDFTFRAGDTLLVGRESAGVPADVFTGVQATVRIPIGAGTRSLNVAMAAAMVLGEALRQTGGFPAAVSQTELLDAVTS